MTTTYRCIHCGGVTAASDDALTAQALAQANTAHGAGVCVPDEAGDGSQWCDVGQHWAECIRAQMCRNDDGQWYCPAHQ